MFIKCHMCNRGGRGNDKDLCSAGWRHDTPTQNGCHLGTPIVGQPRVQPKLTRSKRRYRYWLRSGLSETMKYGDFLKQESRLREYASEHGIGWY